MNFSASRRYGTSSVSYSASLPYSSAYKLITVVSYKYTHILQELLQERLAVVSIARDDPSTLPSDDPFPRTRMHCDRNAR